VLMKVGEEYPTLFGDTVRVISYDGNQNVTVKFNQTGYEGTFSASNIRKGKLKDKLRRSVRGFGYYGIGPYLGARNEVAYTYWLNMLRRCYDTEGNPSYSDVSICEEWANYQEFAKWCYTQKGFGNKGWHLDKDLLNFNNREYNPSSCVFVPPCVNLFLTGRVKNSSNSCGVYWREKLGKYVAACSGLPNEHLGVFGNESDARSAYVLAKKERARELALIWEAEVDEKVFTSLYNYQVEEI